MLHRGIKCPPRFSQVFLCPPVASLRQIEVHCCGSQPFLLFKVPFCHMIVPVLSEYRAIRRMGFCFTPFDRWRVQEKWSFERRPSYVTAPRILLFGCSLIFFCSLCKQRREKRQEGGENERNEGRKGERERGCDRNTSNVSVQEPKYRAWLINGTQSESPLNSGTVTFTTVLHGCYKYRF